MSRETSPIDGCDVTGQDEMALNDAERQARRREKLKRQMQTDPRIVEAALLQEAERCAHGTDRERHALADKLMVAARDYLHRAQRLAEAARRLRLIKSVFLTRPAARLRPTKFEFLLLRSLLKLLVRALALISR